MTPSVPAIRVETRATRRTPRSRLAFTSLIAGSVSQWGDPRWNPPVRIFTPNPETAAVYRERRRLFDDVYTALRPLYPRLRIN